jgi:nicotinamidase-related amidase
MADRPTDSLYEERGFGKRQGMGESPALVVVDFSYGFTDPESPLHCDCDDALGATARLLEVFRKRGAPVVFTTVEFDEAGREVASAFIAKVPAMGELLSPGSHWTAIDERVAPLESEPVLPKLFASAFFGTPLATLLARARCDAVIVTGASTSGCVRATAVDALQHGYRVVVAPETVADRAAGAHEATLTDIGAKYGDVLPLNEMLDLLGDQQAD